MDKLILTGTQVYENDIRYWDQIIIPKLENNEKPVIFSSITYLTPNFMSLIYLKKLAELSKKGFKVVLILWDTNALKYKNNKKLHQELKSEEEFFNYITEEVSKICSYYGIKKEDLIVNRISKVWKKLVLFDNQSIFFQYYNTLMDFKNSDFDDSFKISHLLQMPMDIFIATYYHKLYPEHTKKPIDAIFSGENKKNIYTKIRKNMYEKGIISLEKPIFIFLEKIPYLRYNGLIPEWNMHFDEINFLISNLNPSMDEIRTVFKHLEEEIDSFQVSKDRKNYSLEELFVYIKDLNRENLNMILSQNIHYYLQNIKNNLPETKKNMFYLELDKSEEIIDLTNILKNKISIEILNLCDGTLNLTQISKKMNKQISNTSVHVKNLKSLGIIKQTEDGKLKKVVKSVILNL